jgi:hypothetical protein
MLNRKNRYEIIKELINKASPELINELVSKVDFKGYNPSDDPEYRRMEILGYLEEMNNCWNKHNIDMTDRQYIRILNDPVEEKSKVCVIFKDEVEEQQFSQMCQDINQGKKIDRPKAKRKELKHENNSN